MRYQRLTYRFTTAFPRGAERLPRVPWLTERVLLGVAQPRWRPPADVYETPDHVGVTIDLAGVDQDELDVLLYDDALVVEGVRRLAPSPPGSVYYAAEIRQGPFRLEVMLPGPFDPERVQAVYDRGLLQITLPKTPRG